jgi:uncharacterized protein YaeQ
MALKSTIFKAALQVADMDRGYYADHALTIARHPSETDERMMLRVLAFALHADPQLSFGKGISTDDEPDLWRCDLTGAILLWIDVGQPDEKLVRRACGRADQVIVYTYGRGADVWWGRNESTLERLQNLTVAGVPAATGQELAGSRSAACNCNARSRTGTSGSRQRQRRGGVAEDAAQPHAGQVHRPLV